VCLRLLSVQYAERLTIGLEKVIQTVPAEVVRAFYERWYRPENMAVIAAGDFDADAVVDILSEKLQSCKCRDPSPALPIPRYHKMRPMVLLCSLMPQ
jgi:predicted Zn-dependent peptidase